MTDEAFDVETGAESDLWVDDFADFEQQPETRGERAEREKQERTERIAARLEAAEHPPVDDHEFYDDEDMSPEETRRIVREHAHSTYGLNPTDDELEDLGLHLRETGRLDEEGLNLALQREAFEQREALKHRARTGHDEDGRMLPTHEWRKARSEWFGVRVKELGGD